MLTLTLPRVASREDVVTPPNGAAAAAAFRELDLRWARSRALGVVPDGEAHPEGVRDAELIERRARLAEAFRSSVPLALVPDAVRAAGDAGYTALLADPDGVIVAARASERFDSTAARVRLVEGACWNEARRGTNAIGTALFEGRAIAVIGAAHYERMNHGLVCYATPIRDPLGEVVAVFDVTSRVELANPLVGALVQTVAGAFEQVLREAAYARAHPGGLGAVRALIERAGAPAFLVERGGRVVARSAALEAPTFEWGTVSARALSDQRCEIGGRVYRLEPMVGPRDELLAVVAVADRPAERSAERRAARAPVARDEGAFARIDGSDPAITRAKALAEKFAGTGLPILLLAETGTGKDLFAQAIHQASPRRAGPFVAVNCGAIAPTLLESELFGFAPGAFTGANPRGHAGRIGAAHGGTLFLDEVGEMSPAAQATLLRVLEDGRYRRLGDAVERQADVRIVCATCRDLPAMVQAGTFRSDLYYRIRGAVLTLPRVRERTDLPELAAALVRAIAGKTGRPVCAIAPEALASIAAHRWPGNVRELKMTLEVAMVLADGDTIGIEHLPELEHAPPPIGDRPLRAEAERNALSAALAKAGGNLSRAAQVLGVARTTLYRMLRKHGLAARDD